MRRFADRFSGRVVQSVGGCVCACACVFVLTMTLERIDFRRLFFVFYSRPAKEQVMAFCALARIYWILSFFCHMLDIAYVIILIIFGRNVTEKVRNQEQSG